MAFKGLKWTLLEVVDDKMVLVMFSFWKALKRA